MMGLGINGGGICSAEELVNAITAQNQMKKADELPKPEKPVAPTATVTTGSAVPAPKPVTEVQAYIKQMVRQMQQDLPGHDFKEMRKTLIEENLIDDVPSEKMNMDEAAQMIDMMYQRFRK